MPPDRKLQVESLLQRTVAEVLQRGLADPRIKGLVSVTRVEASSDLKTAKVFVSVTPERHEPLTMHGLKDATRYVQNLVKQKVALRLVPHLRFEVDESLKRQNAVLLAIQEGMARTAPSESASAADMTPANEFYSDSIDAAPETGPSNPGDAPRAETS